MRPGRLLPFRRDNSKVAFEAVPSHRMHLLRLARYVGMAEAIAAYVQDRDPPLQLLDVGPGSGRSRRFCQVAGVADRLAFWGIDNSTRRLRSIYEPSRWYLTLGDAQKGLPYPPEHFDICVCEQVLEHLAQPAKAIDEMARVLRPDGCMIIGVPIFPPGVAHVRPWAVALRDRLCGRNSSHVQTFTSRRIIRMACKDPRLQLVACRGFRVVSGGFLSWLEDYHWWYRVNRFIGRTFPWLCTEVQLVLYKTNLRQTCPR